MLIAGAGNTGCGFVQRSGEFEVVPVGQSIECEIAAVDDEISALGAIYCHPVKVVGQFLMSAGKMGVGNLSQAKFRHAIFLPAKLYLCAATEW